MARRFAEGTSVPVSKTRGEIEAMIEKHGASKFMTFIDTDHAVVGFQRGARLIKITVHYPDRTEKRFVRDHSNYVRSIDKQKELYDADIRRVWRALALVIKAKLESVESGVSTFEQEFMPFIVTRDGRTIGQILLPQLDQVTGGADITRLLGAPAGGERL